MSNVALARKGSNKQVEELVYPISLKYGHKDWNIISALREFFSNMLDTKAKFSFSYESGCVVISDQGEGLPKKAFILGESSRDNSQIGQFGEGLKMGFITFLRNDRVVRVETVGYNVLVKAEKSEDFDSTIMKLYFEPNNRKIGTTIYAECSKKEMDQAVSLFLDLSETKRVDDNIYENVEGNGDIYILGLKTTTLKNALFSYNIEDKRLTNRDRNIVDTTHLQSNLISILTNAKNQAVAKTYLSSFVDNPTAYEYQLAFKPFQKSRENWDKVLNRLYKKPVLSSDMKSDIYATAMGYTVLRNVPYNVIQILKWIGVRESYHYAMQYKGEALKQNNKLVYPISEEYASHWKRQDAIRELIANSLDVGDAIRITHNGTEGRISDNGTGLMKKHLIFGISQKSQTDIGKFGEGMKMACLVLARTGSPVKIESVGYTYEAKLEYNEEFGAKLLVIEYNKNSRTKGTSIVFNCKEQELEDAKSLFVKFRGSRKKPIEEREMEVYTEPEQRGHIYVNGLKTTKLDTMFGYNVKNKELVNTRDRNNVDISMLQKEIQGLLCYTKNEEIIEAYLTAWKQRTNYLEYLVSSFYTSNSEAWNKTVKKVFKKACFSTGNYDNEDFIAKQAGYELLSNIPQAVRNILERAGIKRSDVIAKKYRNTGILLDNRIVYPIVKDYASGWTVHHAIKEIIANALDTKQKVKMTQKDGFISIEDGGEGLSKQNLLFGSTNKDDSQIGMFGEGLKMASLVLARHNRQFKVVTKGFEYEAIIERDTQFNADVLVVYLNASRKRKGTEISFKGTEEELATAQNNFLALNKVFKEVDKQIYEPGGNIFINGMFIQRIDSVFSYNLNTKTLLNRDRKSVDMDGAKIYIKKALQEMTNKASIEKFLSNKKSHMVEFQVNLSIPSQNRSIWKSVIDKVFPKGCFAMGTEHDGVAQDRGFSLLLNLGESLYHLLSQCGIKKSSEMVNLRGDESMVSKKVDPNKLSAKGQKRWKQGLDLFGKLYGVRLTKKIEIIETFKDGVETDSTWGLYVPATDMIYVLKELVDNVDKHSFDTFMGVLIHEQCHRITQAHDRTREFEMGLSMELGRIANLYFKTLK
jgi:hypothetical protein